MCRVDNPMSRSWSPWSPCQDNPRVSFHDVLFDSLAFREANSQVKLCGVVILLRSFPIPLRGFCIVLWQTELAARVETAQSPLGSAVARDRRFLALLESPVVRYAKNAVQQFKEQAHDGFTIAY